MKRLGTLAQAACALERALATAATVTLLAACAPATAATIPPEHVRACILKAADTLPKIAGMKIGKSTTKALPAPPNWPGVSPPIQVDIAFTAAGQADSWRYLCSVAPGGTALVQRLVK